MMAEKITEAVKKSLTDIEKDQDSDLDIFSEEVKKAMELADKYASIEPEPYILPLDALSVMPTASLNKEDRHQ